MSYRWLQFSIRSLLGAVLLCALALRFWPWQNADALDAPDLKWREMLFEEAEPLANVPEITMISTVAHNTRVNVKNVGNTTLRYVAAGSEHVQLFQEIDVMGRWTQSNWDWCGTGKEVFDIAPNSSAELMIDYWDDQKRERMLARFAEKGTKRSGLIVLAAEPAD